MSTLQFGPEGYLDAEGTRQAFGALSDDLVAEGHPAMRVNYGDREYADEVSLFLARYRLQASGGGAYGDVRYWQGRRYVRVSNLGTVAVPGTSNHGKRRSGDLAWPYNSNTAAHRRAQQLAPRHNITCEGKGFAEWWHWTFWGPLGAIGKPAAGAGSEPFTPPTIQEDDMATLITGGGQSLVVGNELFGFRSAQEVQAVKGAQVLEVSPTTHYDIIQRFQRQGGVGLPVRVFVKDGNGTVYLLQNGDLTPLVDPATLAELDAKGGPAITLSQAEIDNMLRDRE